MATELYTNVTIGEKNFSIKRFDAKTGLKLARFIVAKAAPIIPLIGGSVPRIPADKGLPDDVYEIVGKVCDMLSDEDVDTIVDKCLRVCYLNLPGGLQPVIDELGHYGVEDVEYDVPLTMRLCFEAIKWGASDFFDGKNSILSLFQQRIG